MVMGIRPRKQVKGAVPPPDYKALYEQSQADLELCVHMLHLKDEQYQLANTHANAITKELLIRMAQTKMTNDGKPGTT
jgi:hypothetical protein